MVQQDDRMVDSGGRTTCIRLLHARGSSDPLIGIGYPPGVLSCATVAEHSERLRQKTRVGSTKSELSVAAENKELQSEKRGCSCERYSCTGDLSLGPDPASSAKPQKSCSQLHAGSQWLANPA